MKKRLATMTFLLSAGLSWGGSQIGPAKVIYVGAYGNGTLFIQVDLAITETGCNATSANSRMLVRKTHPSYNAYLTMATSSYVTGKKIMAKTNGCSAAGEDPSGIFPVLDETGSSYMLFNPAP